MNYTINAFSTALYSTWINVQELDLLIDAGDGLSAGLLQKSRRIKHVFITHPDRDHLNGLPQFIQLNSREGLPIIHYPKDSGSFPAMQDFLSKFDAHVKGSKWLGIEDGQSIEIKKGYEIEAIRNEHIKSPIGIHKSLSYKLHEIRHKLRPEFQHLKQDEIKLLAEEKGSDHLSQIVKKNLISFSGDTPVDDYSKWDHSEILIHESTFLKNELDSQIETRGNKHSNIEEVLRMVKEINVGTLILNHFSTRYTNEEILAAVRKYIKYFKIEIPVHIIYPVEICRDILSLKAINE